MIDCSVATENILLAAHAIGLDAVWIGIYFKREYMRYVSRILGLPKYIKTMAVISIGYPVEEKDPVDRFVDVNVHWEKW